VKDLKASKLGGGRTHVGIGGDKFAGLGLKIGDVSGVVERRLQRTRGIIAKFASRRSKVVKAACPSSGPDKNLDSFIPKGYLDCVLHVRAF